jgi:hypothetical protein
LRGGSLFRQYMAFVKGQWRQSCLGSRTSGEWLLSSWMITSSRGFPHMVAWVVSCWVFSVVTIAVTRAGLHVKSPLLFLILTTIRRGQQMLVKLPNIKFCVNPFSGSWLVTCDRRSDRYVESNRCLFATFIVVVTKCILKATAKSYNVATRTAEPRRVNTVCNSQRSKASSAVLLTLNSAVWGGGLKSFRDLQFGDGYYGTECASKLTLLIHLFTVLWTVLHWRHGLQGNNEKGVRPNERTLILWTSKHGIIKGNITLWTKQVNSEFGFTTFSQRNVLRLHPEWDTRNRNLTSRGWHYMK